MSPVCRDGTFKEEDQSPQWVTNRHFRRDGITSALPPHNGHEIGKIEKADKRLPL